MRYTIIALLLLLNQLAFSQHSEFKEYDNGLIYSPKVMKQLSHIVDSLNIKYRQCDLNKVYYSVSQSKVHYINLDTGDILKAKNDLENNISFEAFIKKYTDVELDREQLVIKDNYKDYSGEEVVRFSTYIHEHSITLKKEEAEKQSLKKGSWIIDYWKGSEYSKERLIAFYLIAPFKETPLAERYARMVQYSNCMVDTNTDIFSDNAKRSGRRFFKSEPNEVKRFLNYVNKATRKPAYNVDDYEAYSKKMKAWSKKRFKIIDNKLLKEDKFMRYLRAGTYIALESGGSNDEFEEYVGKYLSKEKELKLKRNRIVVGGCSMDQSPRIHAMNIAVLSAETVKWEIFLRAHLNIMNDRFQRASDGSYAWKARKTYIRELEDLEIDVQRLLLGISLRIENPSKNHYFGNIRRLGRALAETKHTKKIEMTLLNMIKDNQLDDYNRLIMYYVFLNYNHNVKGEKRKKSNERRLKTAVQSLPKYLACNIKL